MVQNGNAYDEGLDNDFRKPIKAYWADPKSKEKRDALRGLLTYDATKWQYTDGVRDPELVSPDGAAHDQKPRWNTMTETAANTRTASSPARRGRYVRSTGARVSVMRSRWHQRASAAAAGAGAATLAGAARGSVGQTTPLRGVASDGAA